MPSETVPWQHRAATMSVEMTINGKPTQLDIEPREMLLDVIRLRLGLTGVKRSCDVQVCGACTVLLDGIPVSSCCTLAYEANGKQVETIEGLATNGVLHPIQSAFIAQTALQCGFCTPGMILATKALLQETPHPSREEIKQFLAGNLCRCTGYWNILDAVEDAANRLNGDTGKERSP